VDRLSRWAAVQPAGGVRDRPLFDAPLDKIVYWVALVVAALCVASLLWWLWARPRGTGPTSHDPYV
jgi:hypothetical protein